MTTSHFNPLLLIALASCAHSERSTERSTLCWLTESRIHSGIFTCASPSEVSVAVSACNAATKSGTQTFLECMSARKLQSPVIVDVIESTRARRTCKELYPIELCPRTGQ